MSLKQVTILVPVYKEFEWLELQMPTLIQLVEAGAQVVVGLNFLGNAEIRERLRSAAGFQTFEPDEVLSREEHWSRLLQCATGEYVRYLFAGDYVSIKVLRKHVRALNSSNAALAFSARRVSVGRFLLPLQVFPRFLAWGPATRKVTREEFVSNCIATGSNFFGEPSFVTFRKGIVNRWLDGFGYAVELALYEKLLLNDFAIWVPAIAGTFGVSGGSSSEELALQQSADYVRWLESLGIEAHQLAQGKNNAYRKQKMRLLVYRLAERLKGR